MKYLDKLKEREFQAAIVLIGQYLLTQFGVTSNSDELTTIISGAVAAAAGVAYIISRGIAKKGQA